MKRCQHTRTHTVLGPVIVQVICKDCLRSVEGIRYGKQTGPIVQLPEWAHHAYLRGVLYFREESHVE